MRQCEKGDCLENSFVTQSLRVCQSVSSVWNEADLVIGFGNPQTNKLVWVPYNSQVSIAGKTYCIARGEFSKRESLRVYTPDQSVVCLRGASEKLEDLYAFFGKSVEVIRLDTSFTNNLSISFFDWRYLKTEKSQEGWRMRRALRA